MECVQRIWVPRRAFVRLGFLAPSVSIVMNCIVKITEFVERITREMHDANVRKTSKGVDVKRIRVKDTAVDTANARFILAIHIVTVTPDIGENSANLKSVQDIVKMEALAQLMLKMIKSASARPTTRVHGVKRFGKGRKQQLIASIHLVTTEAFVTLSMTNHSAIAPQILSEPIAK